MLPSLTLQDANKDPCVCVLMHGWVCVELSCSLGEYSLHDICFQYSAFYGR